MLIFLFSACVPVAANADTVADDSAVPDASVSETSSDADIDAGSGNGALQVYMLAGSVIGAMVVVALIYKKKDEMRYL